MRTFACRHPSYLASFRVSRPADFVIGATHLTSVVVSSPNEPSLLLPVSSPAACLASVGSPAHDSYHSNSRTPVLASTLASAASGSGAPLSIRDRLRLNLERDNLQHDKMYTSPPIYKYAR